MMDQMQLMFEPKPGSREAWEGCEHESGFTTMAVVPAGFHCCQCGCLIWQSVPISPEALGYLAADWAWHYRDGKPWTTEEPDWLPEDAA